MTYAISITGDAGADPAADAKLVADAAAFVATLPGVAAASASTSTNTAAGTFDLTRPSPSAPSTPEAPAATPAAQAAADEAGVDVGDVTGTGVDDKVLVADVADHVAEVSPGDEAAVDATPTEQPPADPNATTPTIVTG